MYNLRNRNFIKELDFTPGEFRHLLDLAQALKSAKYAGTERQQLKGKEIALLFEKTSTRTRAAFEVAAFDQGAHVTYLDPSGSQLGHKESVADTARVLGRMFDGIEFRGSTHSDIETLGEYAGVPVYNGLTNDWHPTQMLADMLTMKEHARRDWSDISFAFLGDCRYNMARSLLITGAMLGCDVRLVGPESLWPAKDVIDNARQISEQTGAEIALTAELDAGLANVDFVHTDVWVSMGESKEVLDERARALRPFQVNASTMKRTGNPHTKFMHCLPAFHDTNTVVGRQMAEQLDMPNGIEVTDDVFESTASIVFDQAENRLHTIKAVLVATLA